MKRLCPFLLALCLLLGGCGASKAGEEYQSFAGDLSARSDLAFTAELRAEYEDKTLSYTLSYREDAEGCTVTVLAPETIKGVKAHLRAGGSQLEYDTVVLDTGALDRYGLSPLSALPTLVDTLRCGHLDSAWEEDGQTVWQLIADDNLSVQVWLEGESLTPVHAELISDGRVTVFCDISDWR